MMFEEARQFNQPLNHWDTSKVTSMNSMFEEARQFNQPLHEWHMRRIRIINFYGAPLMQRRYPNGKIPWRKWRERMMKRRVLMQLLQQKDVPMDLLPLFESHL